MSLVSWLAILGSSTLLCVAYLKWEQRLSNRGEKSKCKCKCNLTAAQRQNLQLLQALAKTGYDPENSEHRAKLQQIEDKYANILRKSTETSDWKRLGFQRSESPVTDFRGLGVLTLEVLLSCNAHKDIEPLMDEGVFPFALVLITLTFDTLRLMERGHATGLALPDKETDLDTLLELLATYLDGLVMDIAARWQRAGGDNLLHFPVLYDKFKMDHRWQR